MKKILTILLAAAMAVSLFAGFSVSSSASVTWVEKEYDYNAIVDEWGTEETYSNPVFCGGLWMFEYYDEADQKFHTMQTFNNEPQLQTGSLATQSQYYSAKLTGTNGYTASEGDDYSYCMIRWSGKGIHPAKGSRACIAFVVPAGGVVDFNASVYSSTDWLLEGGIDETRDPAVPFTPSTVEIWVNDRKLNSWDIWYTDGTAEEISQPNITVKEGDKVRFVVNANGWAGGKGLSFEEVPVITYIKADVPIGNPKGIAPELPTTSNRTASGATVKWTAVEGATGYNVYVNGTKVTASPVTGTSYDLTGLTPETTYDVTVTAISAAGESDPSEVASFRTRAAEGGDTDTTGDASSDTTTDSGTTDSGNGSTDVSTGDTTSGKNPTSDTGSKKPASSNKDTNDKQNEKDGLPVGAIIGIVAGAVVLVAAVVVVVIILSKKKSSAPVEAAAEAAETPADENK